MPWNLRHLAPAIALALAAAVLAGSVAAQEQPRKGGTLIYAVNSDPPSYECINTTTFAAVQTLNPHYSQLLKFDPDNYPKVKGDVAESWAVAADGLTYTFKLRGDVKFHDGTTLTSEDVKASYERIRNPPAGVVSVRKADYADITAIEAPDPRTVVFKLAKPSASMLANFASAWNCIFSAAKLKSDPEYPKNRIMGSGPFKFVEHVKGSHWVGVRNEDYFDKGKPYLDGFRAVFIKGAPMINALQGGQIMAEFRGVSPAERDRLKQALGDKIVVSEIPWVCKFDVFFNTKKDPYSDIRVRRALSLAIDRWTGAEALSRTAFVRAVGGVLRPGYPLATPESELAKLPGFGRDIQAARAEAKKLLKEAGQENLKFTLTNRSVPMPFHPVAIYLIDQWRQIGVQVEHSPREVAQQKQTMSSGNFEVGLDANCYETDQPDTQLRLYLSADKSPVNFSKAEDRELDELFEKQKRSITEAERAGFIRGFEKRAIEQGYVVPVVWWHRIVAHSAALHGWKILPSHYLNQDLAGVWLAAQ
ncbi:MAG: ABC transporter substrate-binding protein [Alphaproteobacteria bacterium]|nr:ABC transporter substrate-binding protein [Alphaproteobacteria bacterium]